MSDPVLPAPRPQAFDNLMRAQAKTYRSKDAPPTSRPDWEARRQKLRAALFEAMGIPNPEKPCPLEPKVVGTLQRTGYRIEKLLLQTLPDVWMTATAYVPETVTGKVPAVLVVHGHWPFARRDPVVQARCLGLVKLGFFVLAVDAFGAGERHTKPARGVYHGALYGSTLWPVGRTLLGQQVYDNRRAVDYLRTRPEVDGGKLGITGASGGGNQSMYAGALDERFGAVVPVCSVGTFQAYLHAACCVCEVLPGALRFAEEGDVLSLVAPRALLVVNATRDAFQFSVGEATQSVARAKPVFKLFGVEEKLKHATFESPHDYNKAMREAMYGWMTRWLKGQGDGAPIPEPEHQTDTVEDLTIFKDDERPKGFLYPPTLAAREAKALATRWAAAADHPEAWESTAVAARARLKALFGPTPAAARPAAQVGKVTTAAGVTTTPLVLHPEPEMPLPLVLRRKPAARGDGRATILLHLDGKAEALNHPLAAALLDAGRTVVATDLRATGETKPANDGISGAPDHNSAEHALWAGRPLLGQWVSEVVHILDWLALQPGGIGDKVSLVGLGQAGLVALTAALTDDRIAAVTLIDAPTSLVPEEAYPQGTRMGLLLPGLLTVGDVPQLAALLAPRRLTVVGGTTATGVKLVERGLKEAFAPAAHAYKVHKAEAQLRIAATLRPEETTEHTENTEKRRKEDKER